MDFTPIGADMINLTSTLTPVSSAIEIGYLVLLGLGIIAIIFGLLPRPHRPGPSPWLVGITVALVIVGFAATSAVDSRFSAISVIFGPDPGAISSLVGSWPEVRLAGAAVTLLGLIGLATVGLIATLRLRRRIND